MAQIFYFIKRLYSFSGSIVIFNLFGMVFISLLDSIGVFMLIPLINMSGIASLNNESESFLRIFTVFDSIPEIYRLPIIIGVFLLTMIAQAVLQRNLTLRNIKIQQSFFRHLRMESYRELLEAEWLFYIKKRKSDLINILTSELARVNSGINLLLMLFTSIIFTIIQIVIALWISVKMTLFVLLSGIILMFLSRKFFKKAKLLGHNTTKLGKSYYSGITENFNGIKEIKSNTLEQSRLEWFRRLTEGIFQEQMEYTKLRSFSEMVYKIAASLLIAFFIFLSIKMFHENVEQLLLITIIFSRLWPRFSGIQANLQQIASIIPAFKALINLQNECLDAKEWSFKDEQFKNVHAIKLKSAVEYRQVYFRYNMDDSNYNLKKINLEIPANQMTAIVGSSGAGKSTLVDMLMGLLKPEKGNILIDGKPLNKDILYSLRKSISYVPQDPFLFNGSIRENFLLLQPNATEEQMWEALDFAAADQFAKKLPNGIDTIVGDRGVKLSGGERQRLVLAKAFLRKPAILILDEATSALDSENEYKIQQTLEKLKGTMTIIIIAHRLSTIQNADQVIVLERGEIIQQGQFGQLASEKHGMFNRLLKKQLEISI